MPVSRSQDVADARLALGRRLAALRKAAGYTQNALAPLTLYGRSTVANVERGRQSVGRDFWVRCDDVLRTGGALASGYDQMRVLAAGQLAASAMAAVVAGSASDPVAVNEPLRLDAMSLLNPGYSGVTAPAGVRHGPLDLWAPHGRFFAGLGLRAQVHPAVDDGRILTAVPEGYGDDPFLRRPGRGLVIGQAVDREGRRLFGLDTRHARRLLRGAAGGARLLMPRAYQLDELTLAVLWAVANLDEALLADDGLLEECGYDLAGYARLTRSAASRDLAADLSVAGRMWLGSAFCAGHIRRHAKLLTDMPVFWTREQRGEEASTWLLFTHKQDYLRATAAEFGTTGMVRAFCVPRPAVDASPRGERILLLLAVALMESYGIRVVVTDEPEYAGTAGFVSDRRRHAIVATWIGADGIWSVDVTDHRATVREFADVAGHVAAHSVIDAPDPPGRLQALADYLDLDWPWLRCRCRELAEHGCAGFAQPRSRHLSVAGLDRACSYLSGDDVGTD